MGYRALNHNTLLLKKLEFQYASEIFNWVCITSRKKFKLLMSGKSCKLLKNNIKSNCFWYTYFINFSPLAVNRNSLEYIYIYIYLYGIYVCMYVYTFPLSYQYSGGKYICIYIKVYLCIPGTTVKDFTTGY